LFLDETINNFDDETVQQVSKLIEKFIKENEIKFYMITHNETLKNLPIWDDKITLQQFSKN
jgi:ABC-type lipoprotein export system ATPase subunit